MKAWAERASRILRINSRKCSFAMCLLLVTATQVAQGQTFTLLATFDENIGSFPQAPVIQGLDGNFYGTLTQGSSQNGHGTFGAVYKATPTGVVTSLYEFR